MLRKLFGLTFVGIVLTTLFMAPSASAIPLGGYLKNVRTGMCAHAVPPRALDGPVDQSACVRSPLDHPLRWTLENGGGSTYLIQNTLTGYCMDLPYYGSVEPGTKITMYTCASIGDNQSFYLEQRANGYWIRHAITGLCLDVDGFGTGGEGAALTLWHCTDDDDHNWTFER